MPRRDSLHRQSDSDVWPELARERAERAEAEAERWRTLAIEGGRDLEAEVEKWKRLAQKWHDGIEAQGERIASLMLEEPSKTAGLYAAIDELQRENERLRSASAAATYDSVGGQIEDDEDEE